MVWGAFSSKSITKLAILDERQTAENYLMTLESFMLPVSYAIYGESSGLMQDEVSIHTACICHKRFQAVDVFFYPGQLSSLM